MKKYNWQTTDGVKGDIREVSRPKAIKTIAQFFGYKHRDIKSVRLAN